MKIITSDGVKLDVEKRGNGVPCIYLHGGPGYWSKSFQHFAGELLEEALNMIYLDQRGCGLSDFDENKDYSLTRLIEDIEEVRKQLGIEKWYVLGHSFGGILATKYAYLHPQKTNGLILCNATLNMLDSLTHQIKKGIEVLKIENVETYSTNLDSFIHLYNTIVGKLLKKGNYFEFQYINPESQILLNKFDTDLHSDPEFQKSIFSDNEYFQDFTLLTNSIEIPVMVMYGKYDDAIGPKHHHLFKFKNMVFYEIEGKHHPYIENQRDFKRAITRFVKQNRVD